MDVIKDSRQLRALEIAFFVVAFSGAVSPGILAVWHFAPSLLQHGASLIVLLSLSLTTPLVAINAAFVLFRKDMLGDRKPNRSVVAMALGMGCISTIFVFIIPLILSYFGHATSEQFVRYVLVAETMYVANNLTSRIRAKFRHAKPEQETATPKAPPQ